MRKFFLISSVLVPLTLAACASPQQQCIGSVTRDTRVLERLVAQTEANIERGYAVETQQRVVEERGYCYGRTKEGEPVRVRCTDTDVRTRRVPVAIDLNAEREKLASLKAELAQKRASATQAVAQCQARYPEQA